MTATRKRFSFVLAILMLVSMISGLVTPVYAAEEVGTIYQVDYPRGGGGTINDWGHPALDFMGGWSVDEADDFAIRSEGSYNGQLLYCIEPGIGFHTGDTLTSKDEYFWENYPDNLNPTIDPDTIKSHIGRILVYGYQGNCSTGYNMSDPEDQDALAHIIATQYLIWETVVGERDENFDHVNPASYGKDAIMDMLADGHPLRSKILSYYYSIINSVQTHSVAPSFMSKSRSSAPTYEMEWDGSQYILELTDTNGVLSDYTFSSSTSGVEISRNGKTLIIATTEAPASGLTISATKGSHRMNLITWTDGTQSNSNNGQIQDLITWGERVSDPVYAYLKIKVSYGEAKIVKHSEDHAVSGIQFNLTGNGVNKTVTSGSDGIASVSNLLPGVYTVTEMTDNKYEPQSPQTIEILSGRTTTVTFSNILKRGELIVTKTSEDGLVEGVKFHLYGISLSGLEVDAYATTDASGTARFDDILISGDTPYTLEEVDTAVRYVVPDDQTAPILWNEKTERSFTNILKKFRIEVVKRDAETSTPQGDGTLAGAVYGLYQNGELVDSYTTDINGSFVTDYYICDSNWTLQEISPSEGYLLDETVHPIPAEPGNFTIELNAIPEEVSEQVIKSTIQVVKHIDREDTDASLDPDPDSTAQAPATGETDEFQSDTKTDSENSEAPQGSEEGIPNESTNESDNKMKEQAENMSDSDKETDGETASEEIGIALEVPDELQPVPVPSEDLESSGGNSMIEQPEANAKFQIFLASAGSYDAAKESERDILVTDADGFAQSKELPYGRYRVHQIESGMEGQEFVKDFTVFISENGKTYSYIINNATASSFIRVEKHDAETGKMIPAANVGFQIRDLSSGELITQTVYYPTPVEITTFFTNDEGWMMLPYELSYGRFELLEVQTAYGYVLDSEPVPFEVDGSQTVVTVEKHNMPQKGIIKIQKTGEVFQSVTEQDGMFRPVYETQPLAGAEYTITAAEDILTLDGTIRYEKGQVVAMITTGTDGWAKSEPLYLGSYIVTESKAPDKMVLNSEPQMVELTYAGQEVSLTETSASFYNERQKVEISLTKAMETDEVFGLGMGDELAGVTFGLYAAEDLNASDGSMIPTDGLIEIVSVKADGTALCQTDLPMGSYYLQERSTNSQYLLGTEKYLITFSYAGQDVPTVKLAVNEGNAIINQLIYGSVSGMKLDEDGSGLGGAVIGLFAAGVDEFTRDTALLVTESAENGSFAFEKVPYGTWYVREIEQPSAAYLLCTEMFPIEITENEAVIEINITNNRVRGSISLTKVDADYPDNKLSGAEFEVYRDINGNKELDKEDELLGLMEETEPGFYEMKDIEYGGVLVREKTAPEGFYLDENVYYVSIETDGEVYVIENSAGVGFMNQAHRGNLKIVKTSSDGKADGFTFRITGEDYDRTFVTGSDGVILIEGLRVGKYTVTELEDELSAGYKRPDPVTVELVADETLTVNVHNEKITVDVPKTGEPTNLWFWISLMAASVLAAGTAATVLVIRKKKAGQAENS